jgi:hypothetical protein
MAPSFLGTAPFSHGEAGPMPGNYDIACFNLAEMFLETEPRLNNQRQIEALADRVQQTIEDWIANERDNYEEVQQC